MPNCKRPVTASFKVDNAVTHIATDDETLASLLSHSHSEDKHDLINVVSASDSQHSQPPSELRHRSTVADSSKVASLDKPATPPQLAQLLKESPFIDTHSPMTNYEWFKILILLPWSILRVTIGLPCVLLVWGVVALLVWGNPINTPLPKWRRTIMSVWIKFWASLCVRLGLNFFRLKVSGRQHITEAHSVRPIIIFNHVSYLDGIVMAAIFAPSGIAKASVANMPFFGVCTRALQFLFILRRGTTDEHNPHIYHGKPAEKIAERAVDPRYPLFIVAPEGTTKHKHCLLTFAKGAFAPGLPVMPVLLKYSSLRFNPGWGIVYTAWHFFRVFNQFKNNLEVEVLPIYYPSAEERQSPELYASNVRKVMGDALGAELSNHGIPQQQALKRNGIYVDWTGRYIRQRKHGQPKPTHVSAAPPVSHAKDC
ncbi:hypothetical protein ABBQ32_009979 [Trebouxia sp. C0010 RCD-2024]